jgi:hypothetical protein
MQKIIDGLSLLLGDALLLLLLAGSLLALLVGLLFLLVPDFAERLNRRLNHWISLRRSMREVERSHFIERMLYRHHRSVGLFILLSSAYVLYQFAFHYEQQQLVQALGRFQVAPWLADWLLTALLWFSLPAMLLVILVGAQLALRPSSLKGLEGWGNRWVSTRRWLLPLERPHYPLDRWVNRHPRLFGAVTAVAAAYLTALFLLLYLK